MKNTFLYLSIYYSSSKWHHLIFTLNSFLTREKRSNHEFLIFFDKQKGDAIKLTFCLNEGEFDSFKESISAELSSFLSNHPSVRSKTSFKMGEYLWKLKSNNTYEFECFNLVTPYVDSNKRSFLDGYYYRMGSCSTSFILTNDTVKINVIDYYTILLLLILRMYGERPVSAIMQKLLEHIEENSELRQHPEQLYKIYEHAAEDLTMNQNNISSFLKINIIDLEDSERAIIKVAEKELVRRGYDDSIAFFIATTNIFARHLGIDSRKQLYVLKIFHLYYEHAENR